MFSCKLPHVIREASAVNFPTACALQGRRRQEREFFHALSVEQLLMKPRARVSTE